MLAVVVVKTYYDNGNDCNQRNSIFSEQTTRPGCKGDTRRVVPIYGMKCSSSGQQVLTRDIPENPISSKA